MQETIRWGIIGCGNVTEVKSGPAFNKVENSVLHAVMRRNKDKARDYAERHHVPVWYNDAHDLICDENINAIYIATPPAHHEEYAIAALEKGKMVYVEKPVTTTIASCKCMVEAVEGFKGKLVVAHYRRKLPMFLRIKQMVEEGLIGRIKLIRLTMFQPDNPSLVAASEQNWRVIPSLSGGGYFYDLAPHQLDILQYIFGNPIHLAGLSSNQSNLYPAEDAVSGIAIYSGGVLFQGNWNFSMSSSRKEDSCEIIGEKGSILFPFFGNEVVSHTEAGNEVVRFDHPAHIQQPMIEEVVRYFLGKSENPCSIQEALKSLEMMEAFVYQNEVHL